RLAVAERPAPALGRVELLDCGDIDHADLGPAFDQEADGNAPVRKDAHKIRRTIDRIDDPEQAGAVRRSSPMGSLAVEPIGGKGRRQPTSYEGLHGPIGGADKVVRTLGLDLQSAAVGKIAEGEPACLPGHRLGGQIPTRQISRPGYNRHQRRPIWRSVSRDRRTSSASKKSTPMSSNSRPCSTDSSVQSTAMPASCISCTSDI